MSHKYFMILNSRSIVVSSLPSKSHLYSFLFLPPMMMMAVKSKVIMIIRRRVNQCHYRLLNWGPGRLYQIHIQTASFPKISLSKHIDFEKLGYWFLPTVWNRYDRVSQIVCNFCNWLWHISFNTFNTLKLPSNFKWPTNHFIWNAITQQKDAQHVCKFQICTEK